MIIGVAAYSALGFSNIMTSEFGFYIALFGALIMGMSATLGE